jgi:hypothetical protein
VEGWLRAAVVTASGILLWAVASIGLHTAEPWDSPNYWTAYLIAIGVSAAWGYLLPDRAWLWGLLVMCAQVPVMWFNDKGVGSLWALGLIPIGIMAIPAMGAGAIVARLAGRRAA